MVAIVVTFFYELKAGKESNEKAIYNLATVRRM